MRKGILVLILFLSGDSISPFFDQNEIGKELVKTTSFLKKAKKGMGKDNMQKAKPKTGNVSFAFRDSMRCFCI